MRKSFLLIVLSLMLLGAQAQNVFDMKLKWKTPHYTDNTAPCSHGRSTPLVGDVDGDGEIEVVVPWSILSAGNNNNSRRPNTFITKNLNVLNGKTGELKYTIQTCDYAVCGQGVALADVDGDGKCEVFIVAVGPRIISSKQLYGGKYTYCYDASKANTGVNDYKWKSEETVDYSFIPFVADLNNDGIPEVVVGPNIYNAITGRLLVKGTMEEDGMGFGGPHNVHGSWQQGKVLELGEQYYMFAVADIDGDKKLEICAGNTIYKPTINNPLGTTGNRWEILRQCEDSLPYNDMYDGQTMVLDFDNDGDLDVCVLGRNLRAIGSNFSGDVNHVGLYVWEGQTSEMIGYFVCDPKVNSPGIPSAGDIDGDGFPEVIFNGWVFGQNYGAGSNPDQMHVLKYEQGYSQNDRCKAMNIKEPFTRDQTREFFESAGVTLFDFNQDNRAELVFRGERSMFLLDGCSLNKLSSVSAISGTNAEYPVIADVDQDGHADIIVTEEYSPANGPAGCVSVFESATFGAWPSARKVCNQWPYNVVNLNEDMSVPQYVFDITKERNGRKIYNGFLQQTAEGPDDPYDVYISACDNELPFFYLDSALTESGNYEFKLKSEWGYDSLVIVHFTVNPTLNSEDMLEVCDSELPYNYWDSLLTKSGDYLFVLKSGGCDSVVTLHFTVNSTYHHKDTVVTCKSQLPFTYGGRTFGKNTESGDYDIHFSTEKGCDSLVTLHLIVNASENTEFCMVTVNDQNRNQLVWEKNAQIDHYNLYREGDIAGQYDKVSMVPFSQPSVWVDTTSNIKVRSYRYRISSVDKCGVESALSPIHKTMHLIITPGLGRAWNLVWTEYEGASYSTYHIYRGTSSGNLEQIATLPANNTSYTDDEVNTDVVYYQVAIVLDEPCNPMKAFNTIRSNIVTNDLSSIDKYAFEHSLIIYPNPNHGRFTVRSSQYVMDKVQVFDMEGRLLQTLDCIGQEAKVDISTLAAGSYVIKAFNKNQVVGIKRIVKD